MRCRVCHRWFSAIRSKVRSGDRKCCSKSCRGIAARQALPKHFGSAPKHGGCVGGAPTRLYKIWAGIKRRCYSPTFSPYGAYGARGIRMDRLWKKSFEAFQSWAISHGYEDSLQCDRMDNSKGYNPNNCRWVTAKENCANRRISVIFPNGDTTAEVAAKLGVAPGTIRSRLRLLSLQEAMTLAKVPNGGLRRWFRRHHRIGKWKD